MHAPRRLKSDRLHGFRFLELFEHELALPGGRSRRVVTFRMPDWVAVAATTSDGRFVLVRQHRHGVDATTLEPAGGIVDPGETPDVAAVRELLEETGYGDGRLEPLGWVHPNPALQDNRCHLFVVRDVRSIAAPHQSEDEQTEVHVLTADEVRSALVNGTITHALAVVTLMRAMGPR